MSKKCRAYSKSKLGLEPTDNRKAFYAGWDAALAQQAEGGGNLPPPLQVEPTGKQPLQVESVAAVAENATTQQRVVETPPSDYRRGYWDGFKIGKREGRIEAEDALAQQDEPVEPVAWRLWDEDPQGGGDWRYYDAKDFKEGIDPMKYFDGLVPLYTAPPQRKPLTKEEIMRAFYAAEKTPMSIRHGLSVVEAARIVERAHGIKE